VYTPGTSSARGRITTPLSPPRIAFAVAFVELAAVRTQVVTAPPGPVSCATAFVGASGSNAMSGSPAEPLQPHSVTGLGDSAMKRLRLVRVPLPGHTMGALEPPPVMPATTSRVAPLRQGDEAASRQLPYDIDVVPRRSTPIAWYGAAIHSSTNDRSVAVADDDTATFERMPDAEPSAV
jgi:hypothetical protein